MQVTHIPVSTWREKTDLAVDRIAYLKSEHKYVTVVTFNGEEFLSVSSLMALESLLAESMIRVNRNMLVSRHFDVYSLVKYPTRPGSPRVLTAMRAVSGRRPFDVSRRQFKSVAAFVAEHAQRRAERAN